MTQTRRWLDELPLGAPERALLVAAKGARPPSGAVDAEWQALCLALTAAAGASGAATSGAATNGLAQSSLVAKTASAAAASKATGIVSWVVGVKWFVLGAALGCGVAGAGAVVQRVGQRDVSRAQTPTTGAVQSPAPRARSPRGPTVVTPNAVHPSNAVEETAPSEPPKPPHSAARPDEFARADAVVAPAAGAASAEFPAPPAAASSPLVEQARELAEVKRLIDAGAGSEALRRLDATRRTGAPFALSEERDALYVQALDEAQRRADARRGAREFLRRYPRSPYLAAMRRLLPEE